MMDGAISLHRDIIMAHIAGAAAIYIKAFISFQIMVAYSTFYKSC